jgi:hypothetical protein
MIIYNPILFIIYNPNHHICCYISTIFDANIGHPASSLDPPIPPPFFAIQAPSRQWMGQLAACVVDPVACTGKNRRENPWGNPGRSQRNMITIVT